MRAGAGAGENYAMKVALVHDWLVQQRGGEAVLLELARLLPEAPVYTLVHVPKSVHPEIEAHPIVPSVVQRLPGSPRHFRVYLPLFPAVVEAWDLKGYDLVVSTSHCVAKAVRVRAGAWHLAYIHTPMRYLYDQLPHYLPELGRALSVPLARLMSFPLREWDRRTSSRPHRLLANSKHVAARIERVWGRTAEVVYPPVDVTFFAAAKAAVRRGYVVVSSLAPYKRVDVAVRCATWRGWPLTVVGDGPEYQALRRLAGPTVEFTGALGREAVREVLAQARALWFCGVEDFGLVPVEAMAAGCPVVALGQGGAVETVAPEVGVLFSEPTVEALAAAVLRFERSEESFSPQALRAVAARFDRAHFVARMQAILAELGYSGSDPTRYQPTSGDGDGEAREM